jgi:glycosyltransferase involved in cell wall biosynthesis
MTVKVSVVIPVFNKEKWIVQTLQSVASQTYENWECLIVDDGSTDKSFSLINSFTDATKGNWKVITTANSGQSHARNVGIEHSTGDLLAFLDADDLWLPEKLQVQVDLLNQQPQVDALFSGYAIFEMGQVGKFRIVAHHSAANMCKDWLTMRGFGGLIESTGIIRRTALLGIGGFDESLSTSAGLDLSLRLATSCNLIVLPRPHVLYRLSDDQWHKNEGKLREDAYTLARRYAERLDGLQHVRKWQDSYFFWFRFKTAGNLKRASEMLSSFTNFRVRDWAMLYSLVSRNVVARIRGRKLEKRLTELSKAPQPSVI